MSRDRCLAESLNMQMYSHMEISISCIILSLVPPPPKALRGSRMYVLPIYSSIPF
jgi:hypothetical protein